jgi:hypothetical protein
MSVESKELENLRAEVARLRDQLRQQGGQCGGETVSGTSLDKSQTERYARHIVLRSFGLRGRMTHQTLQC